MPIQTINLGSYANDGTGDDLRTAFQKVNANFAALDSEITISEGANVGTGTGLYKDKNGLFLEFKSLTSSDTTVTILPNTNTVDLKVVTHLNNDPLPRLGTNLDLNGYGIFNGSSNVWTYNFDPVSVYSLVSMLINSNPSLPIDFGNNWIESGSDQDSEISPLYGRHGYAVDMNGTSGPFDGFSGTVPVNNYDFGSF
jgi:hypothetical protein